MTDKLVPALNDVELVVSIRPSILVGLKQLTAIGF